jgi:hypothetical protein
MHQNSYHMYAVEKDMPRFDAGTLRSRRAAPSIPQQDVPTNLAKALCLSSYR